jgi:putative ubiquitin-RnfH superfamily antitoxin RatB of RatAB toxin-antitoxin module
MTNDNSILVEVAYASLTKQLIIPIHVKKGTTVKEAIVQSRIQQQFPDLDLDHSPVGIFGKHTTFEQELREKDRVEIYRPLIADPKEIRRQRAEQGKKMKKGGGNNQEGSSKA